MQDYISCLYAVAPLGTLFAIALAKAKGMENFNGFMMANAVISLGYVKLISMII